MKLALSLFELAYGMCVRGGVFYTQDYKSRILNS